MKYGCLGVFAGLLLTGSLQAQPAPLGQDGPPRALPAEPALAAQPDQAAPWPAPALPAYGAAPVGSPPLPRQVIRVATPGTVVAPGGQQYVDMPSEAPTWYDRLRLGRRRGEQPVMLPSTLPPAMPLQGMPVQPGAPVMLPAAGGEQFITMEKDAESQPPPAPGDLPPSTSPTEPLQLPAPRPLDVAEPYVEPAPLPPGQWWFGVEYLLWFTDHGQTPVPLTTTGTATTPTSAIVAASATQVLFGTESLKYGPYSGGRLSGGFWFTAERILGLEANIFFSQSSELKETPTGSNATSGTLFRPFINAATGLPVMNVVASTGVFTGGMTLTSDSQLTGAEINLAAKFVRGVESDWDLLAGLRFLGLRENLEIDQVTQATLPNVLSFGGTAQAAGSAVTLFDHFNTRNQFTGAQLGVRKETRYGAMLVGCVVKVAVGVTEQTIDIDGGSFLVRSNLTTAKLPGGILALPSNMGRVTDREYSVVPQLQLTLAYQCSEKVRFWASYEFLLWTNTVRPGDQIDPVVNLTQVPISTTFGTLTGPVRPVVPLAERAFWVQGISLGLECKY